MSAERFATVGDLASAAIDVLDERGWCTGEDEHPDGRLCLIGAVNLAAYGAARPFNSENVTEDWGTPALAAIHAALARELSGDSSWEHAVARSLDAGGDYAGAALWRWNDMVDRDDIRRGLKYAAESTEPCPDLTIEASR